MRHEYNLHGLKEQYDPVKLGLGDGEENHGNHLGLWLAVISRALSNVINCSSVLA